MKVGDIYIEALKLMFATGAEDITADPEAGGFTLEQARMDAQYADLLLAMPGSLNRCLRDLEVRRVCAAEGLPEAVAAAAAAEDAGTEPAARERLRLPVITSLTPDSQQLDVPECCAVLAPLFIAAELYRREESALAAVCLDRYEQGVAQILAHADTECTQGAAVLEFGAEFMTEY